MLAIINSKRVVSLRQSASGSSVLRNRWCTISPLALGLYSRIEDKLEHLARKRLSVYCLCYQKAFATSTKLRLLNTFDKIQLSVL